MIKNEEEKYKDKFVPVFFKPTTTP